MEWTKENQRKKKKSGFEYFNRAVKKKKLQDQLLLGKKGQRFIYERSERLLGIEGNPPARDKSPPNKQALTWRATDLQTYPFIRHTSLDMYEQIIGIPSVNIN